MEFEGRAGADEMRKSFSPGKQHDEGRERAPILDLESRSLVGARDFMWIVENREAHLAGPPVLL